jgi:hypothetical protein
VAILPLCRGRRGNAVAAESSAWLLLLISTILALLLMVGLGCSGAPRPDYSQLGLVEVAGTITLDGEPLQDAQIVLVARDETFSTGRTDRRGRYRMQFDSRQPGVLPGEKRVRISSGQVVGEVAEGLDAGGGAAGHPQERVPACYNSRSQLTVEIVRSDSQLDFHLRSDCATRSAE